MGFRNLASHGDMNIAGNFARGLQAGNMFGASLNSLADQSAMNRIAGQVQQAGGDITALDTSQFTSPRDLMALGAYQEQYLATTEGRNKVFEAYGQLAENEYSMLQAQAQALEQVRDPDQFGRGLQALSHKINIPMGMDYDPQTKSFSLWEMDSQGNKAATGERMSLDEAKRFTSGILSDPQAYQRFAVPLYFNTISRNNAAMRDPKQWLSVSDNQGRAVTLVPKIQPGPKGIEHGYIVMREGQGVEYLPFDQLGEAGINMQSVQEILNQEKTRVAIEGGKLGLRGAQLDLQIKGEQLKTLKGGPGGVKLSKEDDAFIKGLCESKDELSGQTFYDSGKAVALSGLIQSGVDRNRAAFVYDQMLKTETQALLDKVNDADPAVARAQAANLIASRFMKSGGPMASMGDTGTPPEQTLNLPNDPGSASLRGLAKQGADNPLPNVPAVSSLPSGWSDDNQGLLKRYREAMGGQMPPEDMTPQDAAAFLRSIEHNRKVEQSRQALDRLGSVIGESLQVNIPTDVANELAATFFQELPHSKAQEYARIWQAHAEGEGSRLYDTFVSMYHRYPEKYGITPAMAASYVKSAQSN